MSKYHETVDPEETYKTLLRTGQKLSPGEVQELVPHVSRNVARSISDRLAWQFNPPKNRHERRRREHWQKMTTRALDKAVNAALPIYEAREKMLTKEAKVVYKDMCKTMVPHPDGRFAGHALDTSEIKDLRRALFEIHLMDILWMKAYRAMRRAA
jgi:hypothetical protein